MSVTKKELADLLGVSLRTIALWQQSGMPVLEKVGRGRTNRYCTEAVEAWLVKRRTPKAPPIDEQPVVKSRHDAWGGKY